MASSPKLLLLRGYPGSGKTTVGTALQRAGVGRFVDHNSLLNSIVSMTGNDSGLYDAIHTFEIEIVRKILGDGHSAIVGRGFTSQNQLLPYQELAEHCDVPFVVIRLDAPLEELEKRVANVDRRRDAHSIKEPESLRNWVHDHQMEPFEGEVIIDARKEPSALVSEIENIE